MRQSLHKPALLAAMVLGSTLWVSYSATAQIIGVACPCTKPERDKQREEVPKMRIAASAVGSRVVGEFKPVNQPSKGWIFYFEFLAFIAFFIVIAGVWHRSHGKKSDQRFLDRSVIIPLESAQIAPSQQDNTRDKAA